MKLTQSIKWAPFSDKHKAYIQNAFYSRICVAEGAIRSGKTIDHCIIAANYLETCRDKFHLATGSDIGNAKLNIGECNGFGLACLFRGRCRWGKYKNNEALFIQSATGEKIVIFAGGGKSNSYKHILGNSYGLWIATEINEHFDSADSRISFIKVAFGRQAAALDPLVLWDLNPCSPGHSIYSDYIDLYQDQELDGYLYEHFTIDDNLSISEERREQIKAQYDPKSIWYKRDILGMRCIAEGLVYPMFSEEEHVIDEIPWQAIQRGRWYVSIDYGTVNPCAMELWTIYNGVAYLVKESYYDSRQPGHIQRTDEEHYAELERLIGERKIDKIVIDPSAASFKATIRKHGKFSVWDAQNDVINGIRFTATALKSGRIKIHSSCVDCIREFQSYMWDSDATEDAVIKENDHSADSVRYLSYTVLSRYVR